jgi:hypothetical protein
MLRGDLPEGGSGGGLHHAAAVAQNDGAGVPHFQSERGGVRPLGGGIARVAVAQGMWYQDNELPLRWHSAEEFNMPRQLRENYG